jgi:hypothetical protein
MNIFYVNEDPVVAAKSLCDKHVIKMILESAQMLSTAHHVFGNPPEGIYKKTHENHPCNVWIRLSHQHYEWVYDHAIALCKEYTDRYGRVHKTEQLLITLLSEPPTGIPAGCFLAPPQCMPEEYRGLNTVKAYRKYYIGSKAYMATWKRGRPKWFHTQHV